MTAPPPHLAAVILTGGTGARLGGADKASLVVDGRTLLERALLATSSATEVVVVGPRTGTSRPVTWAREDPPGGGPAAGLLVGVHALATRTGSVCVLAVDMAGFSAATLSRLRAALEDGEDDVPPDAVCLRDGDGRLQWLAGVYRYDALLRAAPDGPATWAGLPMHRLVAPLRVLGIPADEKEAHDVDTWEDLEHLRE